MNRKRFVAAVCVISMLGGILCACSSTEETTKKKSKKKTETETEEVSTKKSKKESSKSGNEPENDGGAPAVPPTSGEEETSKTEETSKEDDQLISYEVRNAYPFSEGRAWCYGIGTGVRKCFLIDTDGNVLYSIDDFDPGMVVGMEDLTQTISYLSLFRAWGDPLVHMRVKNGLTYYTDPIECKGFVILDANGNELYSAQANDSEQIVIVNRCNDSFLVRKTVANMTDSTTSFYLIDKNGNQIGDFYVEGPTSELGEWADGNVYTSIDGFLCIEQQDVYYEVDPDTGVVSTTPYETRSTKPFYYLGEWCYSDEPVVLPSGISPDSIESAEVSGEYYYYKIKGADGNTYHGIADQAGNFLYEPIASGVSCYGTDDGYILFHDHIVTPEGKILSSLEEYKSLPTDLCIPGEYEYSCDGGDFIREGFISLDLYIWLSGDETLELRDEYSYISIDGTKKISRFIEVEEN